MHISIYYNVISYYNHFLMFYGDFPLIPLILVITQQDMKIMFCVFLSFRNLSELKLTQDFWSVSTFYHERHLEIKKSTRRGPGAKRDQVARGPRWVRSIENKNFPTQERINWPRNSTRW
jgi:hypothetical protein